jgi:hypothetical protein
MAGNAPIIYDLQNNKDAARFGLTPAQRDQFMEGCFWNRNGAKPRAIFCHIQEGMTKSSLKWAIEKPGSQNSYSATVQLDGSILLCIPEQHGPWTNGAVRSPKKKAAKLLALGGNPNLYTLSIECEGYYNKPHPQVQIDAIYWLIKHWSETYGIPVLGDDSAGDWLFEHADVDTEQRSNCAGPYYDTIQRMVREGGDAKPVPPVTYATPKPIAVLTKAASGDIAPATVYDPSSKVTFIWCGDTVRATKATGRYQYADTASARVGPDINAGETFSVDWIFQAADGEYWYYTSFATRLRAKDTERVSDAKAA